MSPLSVYRWDAAAGVARRVHGRGLDWMPPTSRPPAGGIDPTTGATYVTYESLYQAGDSVTQALNRAPIRSVVTFPEDEFVLTDFAARTVGGIDTGAGINLQNNRVAGLWGSGRGTLGGSSGTVFRLAEGSSTKGGDPAWTPTQAQGGTTQTRVIRCIGNAGVVLKNFQVVGSAQGHNFHGVMIESQSGPVLVEDLLIAGWEGDNGAPPGETSGLGVSMASAHPAIVRRVEVDGRRVIGGPSYGTVGIHMMRTLDALVEDCHVHHQRISAACVAYHSYGTLWRRCVMGDHSANGWPYNSECSANVTIDDCDFGQPTGRVLHINWSTTTHSDTWAGITHSSADGRLLVKGCRWPNREDFGGRLAIESWTSGIDGSNTDTMVTPPHVVNAAGQGLSYRWVHGTHHDITSPDL